MTVASTSRQKIVNEYTTYDRRLTLMCFDKDTGARKVTMDKYPYHRIFRYLVWYTTRNVEIRIFIDLPDNFKTLKNISEVPDQYLWNPDVFIDSIE